ncbi:hypothetical protein [Jiella avicenniae]|uniref:Uncharacterized protein n=1 Tax=Jiella avicenniae TaxID=2907202 RepID=A0A9X1T574_9HYPH|nr:hypothetical protein [Jiella avicenniae]MCE7028812.1 hypothetical protein [Jiella avicenniae]
MQIVVRAAFLAATALAVSLSPAAAQSDGSTKNGEAAGQTSGEASGQADGQNLVLPPDAAPTPMNPAETETPQKPAAAGGDASDATESGAPLGAAPPEATSGGDAAGSSGAAAPENGAANDQANPPKGADGQPRNAVGDEFQLPHLTDENQVKMIAELCGIQIRDASPETCTCLGEQAVQQLTPPQRDYLIATVVAPPTADKLVKRGTVSKDDQMTIITFLNATSDACKTGTYVAPDAGGAAPSTAPDAGQSGGAAN